MNDGEDRAQGPFLAAIFDMDGLLVDSEPLWHEAEVEIYGALGVPIAADDARHTKGMFVGEVARFWYERFPWDGPAPEEVARLVVDRVIALVESRGVPMPGVEEAIGLCRAHGLRLALASSSEYRLIDVVVSHLGLESVFEVRHSAEDEPYGKPHPAVFIATAALLDVPGDRCLVFEDAPAGVLASKAARMTCVAVPAPDERHHPVMGIADSVLGSLLELDEALWDVLADRRETGGVMGEGSAAKAPRPDAEAVARDLPVGQ